MREPQSCSSRQHFSVFLVAVPLLIGLLARTTGRATLFSGLSGFVGSAIIVGLTVAMSGADGLPPALVGVLMFGGGVGIAATVGWLTNRIAQFFRQKSALAAVWSSMRLLLLTAIGTALLYVLVEGLWTIITVDLADELPWLIYLRLNWTHYAYVGAAVVLALVWWIVAACRGQPSNAMGRAVVQVVPGPVIVLLFVPMVMAYPQFMDWTPLVDCSPRRIPGYVPHMVDYGRFVLRSLANGALFGLNTALGWQSPTCVPLATSRFAIWVGHGLNVVPAVLFALVAYRYYCLRNVQATLGHQA